MNIYIQDINSDYNGFNSLINLEHQLSELTFEEIYIDMSAVNWFDANMAAPFGAILYKTSRNSNSITICNTTSGIEKILSKNNFLSYYGHSRKFDTYRTTIEYRRFETKDSLDFVNYIKMYLVGKGLPDMSIGLRRKFELSLYEIFENAVVHSNTELGIYSCGQYFPNINRLDFTITDLGIGFRRNIKERIGLNISSDQAIEWAISEIHTTKTGSIPGGNGLKLLKEFISLNGGCVQIVSDRGYWQMKYGNIISKSFLLPFPGSIINLEFNTADSKKYQLSSEISPNEIF
ncbi:MAG: hypothetical protein P9X24_15940 [Candidatus Hatepunaea meridiana]|nr:hypothetical protein [Candidatus Hatepunaea meridiana]